MFSKAQSKWKWYARGTHLALLAKLQVLSVAGCKGEESKSRNLALSLRSSPTKGLWQHSLTVLYSLKKLNLSDYNLLEGALPCDLSSLSCLECLDHLSRNSFITMPANLSQQGSYWKTASLQSLLVLPSSIKELLANDCTSLETFFISIKCICIEEGRRFQLWIF